MIRPLVYPFCFYFYVSGHTNVIHSLSRDRGDADHFPRLSLHFSKMGIMFALFFQLLETCQVITPFLSLTDHSFAVSSLRCLSIQSHGVVCIQLNKVVTNLIAL